MSRYRARSLTPKNLGLLSRAASIEGDEGVVVNGGAAISAQALRRRGLVHLVNQRDSAERAGYLVFITPEGREELARSKQKGTVAL
jgi:hypothetical protein